MKACTDFIINLCNQHERIMALSMQLYIDIQGCSFGSWYKEEVLYVRMPSKKCQLEPGWINQPIGQHHRRISSCVHALSQAFRFNIILWPDNDVSRCPWIHSSNPRVNCLYSAINMAGFLQVSWPVWLHAAATLFVAMMRVRRGEHA